jgi:hypothetical protein
MSVWSRIKTALRGGAGSREGAGIESYEDLERDKELKERQLSGTRSVEEAEEPGAHRRAALSDLTGDGGGQMTEVGVPYSGEGEVQHGVRDELQYGNPGASHRE